MLHHVPCIVFITIPGNSKTAFANELHAVTDGSIGLVIIQKQNRKSLIRRLVLLIKDTSPRDILNNFWYAFLLRISQHKRKALTVFRNTSMDSYDQPYIPPVMEVTSINSEEVHQRLKDLAPDLLVVWGSGVLKKHILTTAKKVINLHLGLCPYYRGAIANQYAIFKNDMSRVGATIHYVNDHVDTGDVLKKLSVNILESAEASFKDLNDRAYNSYLTVAKDLFFNKDIPSLPQDASCGRNVMLKEWTPEMRYKTAQKMLLWNK